MTPRSLEDLIHPTVINAIPILRWFEFKHLPPHLQEKSAKFAELAAYIAYTLPRDAEQTVALRKLLEAKDAADRCGTLGSAPSGLQVALGNAPETSSVTG
jgi:hypothetical protein